MTASDPSTSLVDRVLAAASALEALDHAIALADRDLALLAAARLRVALAAVDETPPARDDEEHILAHLRTRCRDLLARAPTQLVGAAAALAWLARFGRPHE